MSNNIKTNRSSDSAKERALIPILKELLELNIKDSEIILTDDKQSQQLGSDFRIKSKTIFGDENFHVVDAKAATNYIKKIGEEPIPTFAMELMSLQRNNRRSGWVFETDEYYGLTEYFCFQWIFVNSKSNDITKENVASIKVVFVPKTKLQEYITTLVGTDSIEISKKNIDKIYNLMECIYEQIKDINKSEIATISVGSKEKKVNYDLSVKNTNKILKISPLCINDVSVKGPKLSYSPTIAEKPLNLVIARFLLEKIDGSCVFDLSW